MRDSFGTEKELQIVVVAAMQPQAWAWNNHRCRRRIRHGMRAFAIPMHVLRWRPRARLLLASRRLPAGTSLSLLPARVYSQSVSDTVTPTPLSPCQHPLLTAHTANPTTLCIASRCNCLSTVTPCILA